MVEPTVSKTQFESASASTNPDQTRKIQAHDESQQHAAPEAHHSVWDRIKDAGEHLRDSVLSTLDTLEDEVWGQLGSVGPVTHVTKPESQSHKIPADIPDVTPPPMVPPVLPLDDDTRRGERAEETQNDMPPEMAHVRQ